MQFHLERACTGLFPRWKHNMQQPMNNPRDEEPEEIAQVIDVIPAITVTHTTNSTDESS
jgi:hypothetical protein